jgi:N4-gp56 family major capsid protein
MADTITQIADLINPEVNAPIISYALEKALRFTPLAKVDTTLENSPGSTLKMSKFTYIGDAKDVAEGAAIPLDKLGTKTASVTVKKAAKGTQITDEAVLNGYGDPVGESNNQLALALANKIDDDLLAAAKTGKQKTTIEATVDGLLDAINTFTDDSDDSPLVLVTSPKVASAIRRDAQKNQIGSDIGADAVINNTKYAVEGVQIVVTNKLGATEGILLKVNPSTPPLKLIMKRGVQVETDRDIVKKTTIITADEHYAAYLYDDSKVVVVTFKAPAAATPQQPQQ